VTGGGRGWRRLLSGRHLPRHGVLATEDREYAIAAMNALYFRDINGARSLLKRVPADYLASQVLPVTEALWLLTGELTRSRERAAPRMSPLCQGSFCYRGLHCSWQECACRCHARTRQKADSPLPAGLR
jgi:hypothetical protein